MSWTPDTAGLAQADAHVYRGSCDIHHPSAEQGPVACSVVSCVTSVRTNASLTISFGCR